MFNPALIASTLGIAVALVGCSSSSADSGTTKTIAQSHAHSGVQPGSGGGSTLNTSAADIPTTTKSLLNAAEPFEALTETAFSASQPQRTEAIEAAADAVRGVQGLVPQSVMTELNRNMAAIAAADVADHPADIARASIENYRTLVSAVPGSPTVPIDVSLLDYAGFRFDADAQAKPAHWEDMGRALAFARHRWSSVATQAAVANAAPRFKNALASMARAVRDKNIAKARAAAKTELDLVDVLEAAFEHATHRKAQTGATMVPPI